MEKEHNKIGKFAEYFIAYLFSLDLSSFKDLNFLLKELPNIKIKDGYGLDAFDCGSEKGYYLRPYCYDLFPFGYYYPASQNNGIGDETYNDKLKIRGLLSESEAMKIPSVLSYFSVPFTEEGIMEAWMLDNLSYFLPREWHAYYDLKEFIFCSEDIKRLFPKDISGYPTSFVSFYRDRIAVREQVLSLEQDELFPSMTIEGDSAMICFTYWQDDIGLVKASIPATRTNETVCFMYEKTTLVKLVDLSNIKQQEQNETLFFIPTTASVFGLDDEFNYDTKRAIVGHEIQEGQDSIMAPYEYLFESVDIKFDDIHHPELI